MQIDTAFSSALQGIKQGEQRVERSAYTLANASLGNGQGQQGVTQALVDLKTASVDTRVSVKVLKTVNDTLGTLLDTVA